MYVIKLKVCRVILIHFFYFNIIWQRLEIAELIIFLLYLLMLKDISSFQSSAGTLDNLYYDKIFKLSVTIFFSFMSDDCFSNIENFMRLAIKNMSVGINRLSSLVALYMFYVLIFLVGTYVFIFFNFKVGKQTYGLPDNKQIP